MVENVGNKCNSCVLTSQKSQGKNEEKIKLWSESQGQGKSRNLSFEKNWTPCITNFTSITKYSINITNFTKIQILPILQVLPKCLTNITRLARILHSYYKNYRNITQIQQGLLELHGYFSQILKESQKYFINFMGITRILQGLQRNVSRITRIFHQNTNMFYYNITSITRITEISQALNHIP